MNLSRQSKLVPPDELTKWNFHIFGIGSVGSHIANLLAKTGFQNLFVYDMDKVDEENIGPQAFRISDIGKDKVEAIKEIIKENTDFDIEAINGIVDENTDIPIEPNTFYICVFDSIAGRKMVYDKIKNMPCIFIDGRIGRYEMSHFLVNCVNEDEKTEYEKTLPSGEGSDLVCGEKASAFINYTIAGLMVSNIINFVKGEPYTKRYLGNALNHLTDIEIKSVLSDDGSGV